MNILCNYTSGSIGVSKDFIKNIRKNHLMTIGKTTYLDIGKTAYLEHFINKNELDAQTIPDIADFLWVQGLWSDY